MTRESGNHLAFPFRIATDGKAAQVSSLEQHIREELIQLLLTNIGERLFLPEFGGGLRRLVFEAADDTAAGMSKATITQAISRWLSDRVTLQNLAVDAQNETITITIQYRIAGTDDPRVMTFQHTGG